MVSGILRGCRHGCGDCHWDGLSFPPPLREVFVIGAKADGGRLPGQGLGLGALLLLSVGACLIPFLSFREQANPVQGGKVPGEGVQDA